MIYEILRTAKADEQLRDIILYIAEDSGDADVALRYLDKLEKAIMNLSEFPYIRVKPRYSILQKQGYWVLIVERHLVFYKVDEVEKAVIVYAVMDSRREYGNLI